MPRGRLQSASAFLPKGQEPVATDFPWKPLKDIYREPIVPATPRLPTEGLPERRQRRLARNRACAQSRHLQIEKCRKGLPQARDLRPAISMQRRIDIEDARSSVDVAKIMSARNGSFIHSSYRPPITEQRIISIDCEMSIVKTTRQGKPFEKPLAAWVVITDQTGEVVLDQTVKHPANTIHKMFREFHGLTFWYISKSRSLNHARRAVIEEFLKADLIISYNLSSDLAALLFTTADQEKFLYKLRDMAVYCSPYRDMNRHCRLNLVALIHLGLICQENQCIHHPSEDARVAMLLYQKERCRIEENYLEAFRKYYVFELANAEHLRLALRPPADGKHHRSLETREKGNSIRNPQEENRVVCHTVEPLSEEAYLAYKGSYGPFF